ncbi:8038_t:CDS:2 [Ambispora leptoticha]|uniref:8038_t:CDS:1 n=1 Tax=Ambispora leptoticha TaxID=144679 RepID=A0A9N8V9C9_9GLOM|nr:8038_t:CDS:2 [Ambispora leptoticha]
MATRTDHDTLIEMGFPPEKVARALKETGGLQQAMDWLIAHPGDLEEPAPAQALGSSQTVATSSSEGGEIQDGDEIQDGEQTAQSLQCNDCQILLRDATAAERHAIRTGHVNFSESTTAIKPLTEEEKAAKLAELKKRLAEKRAMRLLAEQEEEKNREKVRRTSGKELAKIKAQIEADKKERAAKREAAKLQANLQQQEAAAAEASSSTPTVKKEYTETRLQIRRQDGGATIIQTFKTTDTLQAVYEYVGQHVSEPFKLITTFPRKVLDRDTYENKTLKELDLGKYLIILQELDFTHKLTEYLLYISQFHRVFSWFPFNE